MARTKPDAPKYKFAFRQSNKKISGAFPIFERNWLYGVKIQNNIRTRLPGRYGSGFSARVAFWGKALLGCGLCLVLGAPFWYFPARMAIQVRQFSRLERMEQDDPGLSRFVFHQKDFSAIKKGKREFFYQGLMHDIHSMALKGDSLYISALADYAETEWLKLTYRYKNPPPGVSLNASFFFLFYFFQPLPSLG